MKPLDFHMEFQTERMRMIIGCDGRKYTWKTGQMTLSLTDNVSLNGSDLSESDAQYILDIVNSYMRDETNTIDLELYLDSVNTSAGKVIFHVANPITQTNSWIKVQTNMHTTCNVLEDKDVVRILSDIAHAVTD
jgi:hypothetical protein